MVVGVLEVRQKKKKKSKQARVPTFVWLLCDDATNAKGRGCEEGTNLH